MVSRRMSSCSCKIWDDSSKIGWVCTIICGTFRQGFQSCGTGIRFGSGVVTAGGAGSRSSMASMAYSNAYWISRWCSSRNAASASIFFTKIAYVPALQRDTKWMLNKKLTLQYKMIDRLKPNFDFWVGTWVLVWRVTWEFLKSPYKNITPWTN